MSDYLNLKEILLKNAKTKIINDLENDMNLMDNKLNEKSLDYILKLSEKVPLQSLTPLNLDIYKEGREYLTRKNYNFPSFLNIGNLKNWHSMPSRLIGDKIFPSSIPFLLPISQNGVGFFMNPKFKKEIISTMELMAIKLLSSIPDGLARITIIDKNGAGQNFPTLLMLNDKFTEGKILAEDNEIERDMLELKQSMKTITQSITSNGFDSIEDYNKNTDEIPQAYRFLFISNFPSGFSKKAAEALVAILESGHNAGIYTFINFTSDPKYGMNQQISGIPLSEFTKNISLFEYLTKPHDYTRRGLLKRNINLFSSPLINDQEYKKFVNNSFKIEFEEPNHHLVIDIIEDINNRIQDMNLRPIIDIRKTLPEELWTENAGKGVCAPFAKSGIENIFLSLGINQFGEDESTHHGIIGGATGSGKTVTLHDMILHLCLRYSPKDLNFWLLDYKEGTEFAVYEHFPYIQILSMESEVEFGQEVLSKANDLMEERGALFKTVGAANLFAYNSKVPEEKRLPRVVLIIDEFQALFPKQAQVTAITNERIDRILRLGRSFGVNLLLSTQTLKGVDMDAQLLSNMPLRIALKMDEKDAIKLFGDENSAPKFLKDPGEGIYNKSYGLSTANVHFQAYLALGPAVESIKAKLIDHMNNTYDQETIDKIMNSRFVYNGDKEALIENNKTLNKIKENNEKLKNNKFYIGEPAGLSKEHAFLDFKNDFADNLLMVGMDIDKAASITYNLIDQLTISDIKNKIYMANYNKSFKNIFQQISKKNDNVEYINNISSEDTIEKLIKIFEERQNLSEKEIKQQEQIFFINFFIENSKIFTASGYGNDTPLAKLKKIIYEGPEFGIHIIIYATSFQTLMSTDISRDIDKFKKKIIFQGGNSLKALGEENTIKFSKSPHVAIATKGEIGIPAFKFKPYVNKKLFEELNNINEE
jgi:Cdc6-like AAA superfamily ATPase